MNFSTYGQDRILPHHIRTKISSEFQFHFAKIQSQIRSNIVAGADKLTVDNDAI